MSTQQWSGDPWPHVHLTYTGVNTNPLVSPDGSGIVWTTSDGTYQGHFTIPPQITPIPQPFLPQQPIHSPFSQVHISPLPLKMDKERTSKLDRILGKRTVYIRKALKQDVGTVSIDVEINDIEPPQDSAAGSWEGAAVLFNSIVNGSLNMTQNALDDFVGTFASMLTLTGTCVIVDGKEYDPS